MINGVSLGNFFCFRRLDVETRLITVFIGPNGTGKSTVIQALELLKQSMGSNAIQHQGIHLNLSDPSEIVPKFSQSPNKIRVGFRGSVNFPGLIDSGFDPGVEFSYVTESEAGRAINSHGGISGSYEGQQFSITVPEGSSGAEPRADFGSYAALFSRTSNIARLVESAGTTGSFPTQTGPGFQLLLTAPNFVLSQIRVVPAVRGLVRPKYALGNNTVEDVTLSRGLSGQEDETASNLGYSRDLEAKLSELLERVTGVGLMASLVPPQSVDVRSIIPSGSVTMAAEGFGSNALILLFHQLIKARQGATVLIEEPEIHLHPRAQAELASVLVNEAKAQSKQIIMTTHSEHVLGRLLTLVAEKNLALDDLAIYSFSKDSNGVCSAELLEVADDGRIEGGLKDFFEPHLDELNRYVQALQSAE